jgi:hypothetical protein
MGDFLLCPEKKIRRACLILLLWQDKFRTLDPVEVISAQICRNIKPFEPIAAF